MDVVLVVLLVIMSVAGMAWIHRRQSGAGFVARALTRATAATVDSASGRAGTSVALTGVVRAGAVVPVSAATGRAYVARDLRLRPFDGASASSTRSACEAVDFLLEDDTGVAFVRAGQAMVVLPRDVQAPTTTLDQAPWARELLRQTGYHTGSPQQCRLSVWEGVLAPGDRVQVVGTVAEPDEQAQALAARIAIVPGQGGTVGIRRAKSRP